GRSRSSFALQAFQSSRAVGELLGQELDGYPAPELQILGHVHEAHSATAQQANDPIVRDSLPYESLRAWSIRSMGGWACRAHVYNGGDKAIAAPDDGLHKPRLLGIIFQHLADLSNRRIDAVVRVKEHVLAPDPLNDPFARDQLAALLDQQKQQLHRNAAQSDRLSRLPQFKCVQI